MCDAYDDHYFIYAHYDLCVCTVTKFTHVITYT